MSYYNAAMSARKSRDTNETLSNSAATAENYYRAVPDTASLFSGYTLGPAMLRDEEIYELGETDLEAHPFDDGHLSQQKA